jgi:hypothetical protein
MIHLLVVENILGKGSGIGYSLSSSSVEASECARSEDPTMMA